MLIAPMKVYWSGGLIWEKIAISLSGFISMPYYSKQRKFLEAISSWINCGR